jgi:hypothetical protein
MRDMPIPYQVFISYSHADQITAMQFSSTLQRKNIPTWIDRTGLPSGTPNWNTAIRDALRSSLAFLLLASPQTGRSDVVFGEIAVAKSLGIPIYPLWVQGDDWSECIPLDMVHTQYIDCRDERYSSGISQIATILQETLTRRHPKHCLYTSDYFSSDRELRLPPDYQLIYLKEVYLSKIRNRLFQSIKTDSTQSENGDFFIALCPHAYPSLRSLLDDLYQEYLRDRFGPYTYGSSWILGGNDKYSWYAKRLFVPWEWLGRPSEQPLASYYHTWEDSPPDFLYSVPDPDFSLVSPSRNPLTGELEPPLYGLLDLQILEGPLESAFGIATNNRKIATLLMFGMELNPKNSYYFFDLLRTPVRPEYLASEFKDIRIKQVPPTTEVTQYKYQFVFTSRFFGAERRAFIVE